MKKLLLATFFTFVLNCSHAQKYELTSPDEALTVNITIRSSASLILSKGKVELLKLDDIDLETEAGQLKGMKVLQTSNRSVSDTVIPLVKEKSSSYLENYNELIIDFKSAKALTFRLYNEGLAYRFTTSA